MTVRVEQMTDDEATRLAVPDEDAGLGALATDRGNLPLDAIDVRAAVTGLIAHTELAQGFVNPFDEPLEATYVFPLPDRAAVTGLRMEAADRTVEGVLKERGQARADYDRAVTEGRRASIAEEERPGVFTMRVGTIMPHEPVLVRLTLAGRLPYEDGEATYRFPLVVAPRYIPGAPLPGDSVGGGTAPDTDAVPDASRITPPVLLPGFPNPVRLSFEVDVDPAGLPLTGVRSSLHAVEASASDGHRVVRLRPGERANRDVVLRLALGDAHRTADTLAVRRDKEGAEGTFALALLPPGLTAPARPRDVVLVLDRSGSMGGWKMIAARRAAARIVDTLTPDDSFAVLAFDNVVETPSGLPDGLVAAGDRSRFRAVEHLARMEARGGTEMLEPLRRAADLLAADAPGRERVLVLVTDGQVGNEDQILRVLADRLAGVRVHTVGVDVAVNEAFLHRLAGLGGGRCELVESEDRLDEAMAAIHRRVGTPLVTDLRLEPAGLDVVPGTVSPARVPDLYAGAPIVVTGRFRGEPGSVTLVGRAAGGGPWETAIAAGDEASPALPAIWARGHLRDLEDRYVTRAGEPAERRALDDLERMIVDTSLRFGVLSRFTAFVAVDERVVNEGGRTHRVTQPVDAPQGWAMFDEPGHIRPYTLAAAAGPMESAVAPTRLHRRHGPPMGLAHQGLAHAAPPPTRAAERPAPPDPPELEAARTRAREELRRLEGVESRPTDERARLLTELADRLRDLVVRLERAGVDRLTLRPLRELVEDLAREPADAPPELERRWLRALDVLEMFGKPDPPADPGTPRPGAFWKR